MPSPASPPQERPLCWPKGQGDTPPRVRPYYRWLRDCVVSFIEHKLWAPGQRIPNEWDIAEATGLNVNTVKKALLELVAQGYLVRTPRKGTFVAGYRDVSYRYIFYAMSEGFGPGWGGYHSSFDLLGIERVKDGAFAPEFVCGQEQIKIRRRLSFKGTPAVYSITWFRADLLPGFDRIPLKRFEEQPLYSIMEQEYGIIIRESSELLSAVPADTAVAELLSLREGDPVILSKIINYTDRKEPCEYRESYINTARFSLQRSF